MLYVHVFEWPSDGKLEISIEDKQVSKAYLLADKESKLGFSSTEEGVVIEVPEKAPDAIASVIAIELKMEK